MASPPRPAPIWRHRDFMSLWSGLLVSNLGDWINYVAMFAVVYQQTHSALAVVGLRLVHIVPEFLFAPFAGVFVDRWSRKRTLVVSPLVSAVFVAALVLTHPTGLIFVAELAITLATMFFDPAVSAALPNIVDEATLTQANTLARITQTLATLVGPLVGGILVSTVGARFAFGADTVSFLVIAVLITRVAVQEEARAPSVATIERELFEGVRYLRERPRVGMAVLAGAAFGLGPSTIFTVGIVFSTSVLHAGAAGYGILLGVGGAGSFVAAAWMIFGRKRLRDELAFAASGTVEGAAFIVLGLAHSLAPAAGLYGAADSMATIGAVSRVTLIQRIVPDQLRGRIFGVASSLDHLSALVSAVLAAVLVGVIGTSGLIIAAGAIGVVTGVWILRRI